MIKLTPGQDMVIRLLVPRPEDYGYIGHVDPGTGTNTIRGIGRNPATLRILMNAELVEAALQPIATAAIGRRSYYPRLTETGIAYAKEKGWLK